MDLLHSTLNLADDVHMCVRHRKKRRTRERDEREGVGREEKEKRCNRSYREQFAFDNLAISFRPRLDEKLFRSAISTLLCRRAVLGRPCVLFISYMFSSVLPSYLYMHICTECTDIIYTYMH